MKAHLSEYRGDARGLFQMALLWIAVVTAVADPDTPDSWSARPSPVGNWLGLALSADGKVAAGIGHPGWSLTPGGGGPPIGNLLVSTNSGGTWRTTPLTQSFPQALFTRVKVSGNGSNIIAAGYEVLSVWGWSDFGGIPSIWRSPDLGATWNRIWTDEWSSICISRDGKTLLVGSEARLLRSIDGGVRWEEVVVPIQFASVEDIAASANATTIVLDIESDLIITHDSGKTWRKINWQGLQEPAFGVSDLVLSGDGRHLAVAAGIEAANAPWGRTILASDDGGSTWRRAGIPASVDWDVSELEMGSYGRTSLAMSDDGRVLLAGTHYAEGSPVLARAGPVVYSDDGGVTWSRLNSSIYHVDPAPDEARSSPDYAGFVAVSADGNVRLAGLIGIASFPQSFPPGPLLSRRVPFQPSFGESQVGAGPFQVVASGAYGQTLVMDACTNLFEPTWTPVGTNTLTRGTATFTDPNALHHPGRFYRLRTP